MTKKQVLQVLGIVGALAAGVAVVSLLGRSRRHGEIRIGFAGALSGPASYVGNEIKRGAEIAIEEINAAGGIHGSPIALVARDDENTPKNTVAMYRDLTERQGVVAMLGATNSAAMLAVAPIVNDTLKVPVICPATDATAITENDAQKQGRDNYLFRVGMYGTGQANFMVDTLVERLGHQKVGLLTWTGGWGVTGREELRRRLKERGLTPVADETYDDSDTDMTAQLLKLKAAGAQAILNYGLVRENVFVAKTRQQLKDATPYVSAWGLSGPAFLKAAGESAEGVLVTTTATTDGPQSPARAEFIRKYQARYKENLIAPVFALGAYDAVYLFKTALEKGGKEPAKLLKALHEIPNFNGLIVRCDRPVFTKERHHALTENEMILTRWTQGKQLEVKFDERGPFVEPEANRRLHLDKQTLKPIAD